MFLEVQSYMWYKLPRREGFELKNTKYKPQQVMSDVCWRAWRLTRSDVSESCVALVRTTAGEERCLLKSVAFDAFRRIQVMCDNSRWAVIKVTELQFDAHRRTQQVICENSRWGVVKVRELQFDAHRRIQVMCCNSRWWVITVRERGVRRVQTYSSHVWQY